ncbi:MAG: MBL fold metallo-hydrolase [Alphaproteobacteria bacterium]|nr:MAG: MBL fold metallo-hydrolase [Alphaproteobacteria bacterium]
MTTTTGISRRSLFATAGAASALALAGGVPSRAAAPKAGPMRPAIYRFALGDFEVATLLDGQAVRDNPQSVFGTDQSVETVSALLEQNFLDPAKLKITFSPTVVNTGAEVILFDTGLGAGARGGGLGQTRSRLEAAGIAPEQVDIVVITHFHPDHIGGLMEDGTPAFPNARYVTGAVEHNFWSAEERMSGPTARVAKLTATNVTPLNERMSMIKPGDSVASGIEAVEAFGHTPGHMAYHIESAGQRLMLIADTSNHFVLSLQRPDWEVLFDMDKGRAAATRKSVLGMIAADRIPFIGYHMPPPAIGYLEALSSGGFRYHPVSYQLI